MRSYEIICNLFYELIVKIIKEKFNENTLKTRN